MSLGFKQAVLDGHRYGLSVLARVHTFPCTSHRFEGIRRQERRRSSAPIMQVEAHRIDPELGITCDSRCPWRHKGDPDVATTLQWKMDGWE